MIKWIKNSKASKTNKSSKYRGVRSNQCGKFEASVLMVRRDKEGKRKQMNYVIGTYHTEKEAVKARIEYILDLL